MLSNAERVCGGLTQFLLTKKHKTSDSMSQRERELGWRADTRILSFLYINRIEIGCRNLSNWGIKTPAFSAVDSDTTKKSHKQDPAALHCAQFPGGSHTPFPRFHTVMCHTAETFIVKEQKLSA